MTGDAGSPLTGTVEVGAETAVVTLVGRLTNDALPQLVAVLAAATSVRGPVTLDVSGLSGAERAGVTALQQVAARLHVERRPLSLVGGTPELRDVLLTAGLLAPGPARPAEAGPALRAGLRARAGSAAQLDTLDAALAMVVTLAQTVIGGADGVSITLPRDGTYGTVAASNEVVLAMDHDQYDTDQGPCLDAARHGEPFAVEALVDERRWARFVPRARARGIESIVSAPLRDAGEAHGALNLYSRTRGAFAGDGEQRAHEVAAHASTVLTVAHAGLPSERLDGHLEQALASRAVIAQAQGWVMQRDGVDAETAWSTLAATSRRTGTPLRDVCEDLLR